MDQYVAANAVLSLFSKNYMDLKKWLPIRPSEMGVLNIITQTPGPHTPVMLAELLGVSKPMITAHLTSLSEKGYILKEQSRDDKRAYYVLPTEQALELVERAAAEQARQLARLESAMGAEEFDILVRLAREANSVMERKEEAP